MNSHELKLLANSTPSIGWKRIAGGTLYFSYSVVIFTYLWTTFNALIGNPPYTYYEGNTINFIVQYGLYGGVMVYILRNILNIFRPLRRSNTSLFGLALVSTSKDNPEVSKKQYVRLNIVSILIVATLFLFQIPHIIYTFTLLLQFFLFNLITSLLTNDETNLIDNLQNLSAKVSSDNILLQIVPTLIVSLLFYILFIKFWKNRGIPELISHTKIVDGVKSISQKKQFALISLVIILLIGIYPYGNFLNRTFPRNEESYEMIISTQPATEYISKNGWAISYDFLNIDISEYDNTTVFLLNTYPSSTISSVNISVLQENPENFPLEVYFNMLKEEYNWKVIPDSNDSEILKTTINGNEVWKVTSYSATKYYGDITPAKIVQYFINANSTVYDVRYEQYETIFTKEHVSPDISAHVEKAVEAMIKTFRIVK